MATKEVKPEPTLEVVRAQLFAIQNSAESLRFQLNELHTILDKDMQIGRDRPYPEAEGLDAKTEHVPNLRFDMNGMACNIAQIVEECRKSATEFKRKLRDE